MCGARDVLCATVPQEGFAPESGVVLEKVVNVAHPIVLLPWRNALHARDIWLCYTGAADARYGVQRCFHLDRLARSQDV